MTFEITIRTVCGETKEFITDHFEVTESSFYASIQGQDFRVSTAEIVSIGIYKGN
jgi:hypothetical protein